MRNIYNFLIVEAEYRKVLPVVRHLGRKGYNVYTISLNRFSIGGSSKYVKKNYFLKELSLGEVSEIISKHNVDIVIPSNEKSVEFFAKNIEKFNIPIVVPNKESYEVCRDKSKTLRFAKSLGIRVPETFVFKNLDEFKKNIDKINIFPVVLKPKKSSGSRGIIYVNSRNELLEVLNEEYVKKYEFPLIQEYIPLGGRAIGASFLYYKGEEVLGFCHQRIREYPPNGGPSTLAISVYNEEALNIGRKLLNNLNWNGLAMVEFKEDPRNSELVLMEINPRMWGTIGLAIFSGADFIDAIIKVFLENVEPESISKSYKTGYYFRWFFPGDIMSILKNRDINLLKKVELLFFNRNKPITYQILSLYDVWPAFTTLLFSAFRRRS